MALYKRWKERPLSLLTSSSSPVLHSNGGHPKGDRHQMHQSLSIDTSSDTSNLDTTLTSHNSEYFADYELEISVLQHSPTCSRRKVWSFSSPSHSPITGSRLSSNSSSTPSPDSTPLARDHVTNKVNDSPSLNGSVSSAFQRFANSLRSHSSSAIEGKGDAHRYMVINEMINTERKYVQSLETLQNVYLHALEHVVAPRDLRLLFPAQLEPLIEKHTHLLEKLEERVSKSSCFPGIVGDVFSRLLKDSNSDFLQMYSAYMNEFKVAMTTLAKYDTSSVQFRELLLLCQHSPSCEGLSLASYLLTPIQRLPRYELLLKELLHQTPLDHPDNFYVTDAIDRIHQELVRLNQSIKSCQLACSVRRVSNSSVRKPSFRARTGKAIAMLKRHVSTANIDDYSSGDSSTSQEIPASRIVRRRRTNFKSSTYHSEENLLSGDEDMKPRKPFLTNSLMNIRPATSCSDLMLTFDGSEAREKSFGPLTPLVSLPTTPEPPSPRPTCPSETDSINPLLGEDELQMSSHRLSMCSIASSTSGIGSIEASQFDLRIGSLTPSLMLNSDPMTSTPTSSPVVLRVAKPSIQTEATTTGTATTDTMGTASYMKRGSKKRMSWSAAFKVFNRKSVRSVSANKVLNIGSPKNFRHVQHWFPTLTENAELDTGGCPPSLCQ